MISLKYTTYSDTSQATSKQISFPLSALLVGSFKWLGAIMIVIIYTYPTMGDDSNVSRIVMRNNTLTPVLIPDIYVTLTWSLLYLLMSKHLTVLGHQQIQYWLHIRYLSVKVLWLSVITIPFVWSTPYVRIADAVWWEPSRLRGVWCICRFGQRILDDSGATPP